MAPVLLNMYELGNNVGEISTYVLLALMTIVWIWIMFKYLNTSELND